MKTANEASSLAFFSLPNYAGTRASAEHGSTGIIAVNSSDWLEQSVAMSGTLHTCIYSMVDTGNPVQSYAGHVETYVTASQPDLKSTYPAPQYTLEYLGLDAALAVPVMVDIQGDVSGGQLNALACSGPVPQSSTSSVTTLVLPDTDGILGFIGVSENSSTYVPLKCGVYDTPSHEVTWQSDASLIMVYSGGQLTLTWSTGQPDGWSFGAPVLQADGSWRVALSLSGEVSGNTISSLTADKASIVNNGTDAAELTATVTDVSSGQPVVGTTVNWSTNRGQLSAQTSVTSAAGQATVQLTDQGDTGTATVTAAITGSTKSTDITLSTAGTGATLYQTQNYGGNSTLLAVESSVTLRNTLYQWQWQSVKTAGERVFAHTAISDTTSFDFRTYRNSYDAADNADLTARYPTVLSGATVIGTGLGEDDVVVSVTLVPQDLSQAVVAVAQQTASGLAGQYLASVTDGAQTVPGILVKMNKSQGLVKLPLLVGEMNTDTGLADWVVTTSLIATWNEATALPEVILGSDAPQGWFLSPAQPAGTDGEYSTSLGGIALSPPLIVRGARQNGINWLNGSALVALDRTTQKPVQARWQYEGESAVTSAIWFTDTSPEKHLRVNLFAGQIPVILKPANIAGNKYGSNTLSTFSALTDTGSVIAWGVGSGGVVPADISARDDLVSLNGSNDAFASLTTSGSVVAWGNKGYGGSVPTDIAQRTELTNLCSSDHAFAALTPSGNVVAWGDGKYGGSVPETIASRADLVSLSGSGTAFAALAASGSVVAWGNSACGGSVPANIASRTDLVVLYDNGCAFAALTASGGVVVWGNSTCGCTVPSEIASRTDLVSLCGGYETFAALTASGSVVAWGNSSYGGSVPTNIASRTDLVSMCAANSGFAALTASGSVVAWGNSSSRVPSDIAARTDLINLSATRGSFVALTESGDVVTWGDNTIPEDIAPLLKDVLAVYSNYDSYIALKSDKTVVTWGNTAVMDIPSALQGNISYQE